MIPVIINNKKYQIKTVNELTTKEFIELSKRENPSLIDYISVVTGIEFEMLFYSKIKKDWFLKSAIGEMPNIDKLKPPKWVKDFSIETIGQRYMIETNSKDYKGYDLIVFILAIARISDYMDINKIKEEINRLYEMPFTEIIPAARFFFLHFQNGRKQGNFISRIVKVLIKTLSLKKGLV